MLVELREASLVVGENLFVLSSPAPLRSHGQDDQRPARSSPRTLQRLVELVPCLVQQVDLLSHFRLLPSDSIDLLQGKS